MFPHSAKWRAMVKTAVAQMTSVETAPATPRARWARVRCLMISLHAFHGNGVGGPWFLAQLRIVEA